MSRVFVVALVLAVTLGVSVLLPLADASTKFTYTEEIVGPAINDEYGSLAVVFEEASQKRFASVEYRLDARASVVVELDATTRFARLYNPSAGVTLVPDEKGRISGSLILDIKDSGRCLEFPCGTLVSVDYVDVTLTNLATGKVYRLDNISLSSPNEGPQETAALLGAFASEDPSPSWLRIAVRFVTQVVHPLREAR